MLKQHENKLFVLFSHLNEIMNYSLQFEEITEKKII